jgi:hypothetical protein
MGRRFKRKSGGNNGYNKSSNGGGYKKSFTKSSNVGKSSSGMYTKSGAPVRNAKVSFCFFFAFVDFCFHICLFSRNFRF